MARLATDKKSSTQRTNTNYSSQAQRDKRAVPKAQNKTSYTTLVFPEQTKKSAPASNIPEVVAPSASVREQERISDTSAHAEVEREKARKESHVTDNILFEQWKAATEKKKERESKQPSFLERAKDTITGTLTERLGSDVGALRGLYESGQNSRTAEYEREMAELQPQIERAQRAYDEMRALYGEQGATVEYNTLQDLQRRYDAYKFVTENNVQEQAAAATSDMSNQLSVEGAQKLNQAKEGMGAVGRAAVDIGSGAVNLLADSALGKVGGSTLSNAALGLRGFGNTAQAAESAGAGISTQVTAGAVEAAKGIGMGKLFDGLAGIYGKGAADEIIESAVDKLAKTDAGRNALRALAKSAGEGAEELIESKLDPLVSAIYDHGEALRQKYGNGWDGYKEAAADDLYSGLIGFALGAGGQIVSAARGDYARANEELKRTAAPAVQTAPVQQNTAQPQTENSAVNVVEALLAQGKISNSQAGKVVESPTLADAFYEVTGIALEGTNAQKRAAVKAAAQAEAQTSPVADVQPTRDISTPPTAQNVKQGDSDALNSAVNYNSREAQTAAPTQVQQNTAPSQETENDNKSVVQKLKEASPQLSQMENVSSITGAEIGRNGKIVERLMNYVERIGGKVTRPGFGDVVLTKSKIKSSMIGHGVGNAKIDAFAAVPDVIAKGIEVDHQSNWKGRNYDTYLFAAPVEYKGKKTYVGVLVQKDSASNRYYLHEVVDENGDVIYKNDAAPTSTSDGTSALSGDLETVVDTETANAGTNDISSDISIPTDTQNVKQNFAAEAPTQEQETTENTIMQESDLPDYMATGVRQHVRNAKDAQLKNGGSPILTTIEQIKSFIRSSLRGETTDTIKGYGKVGSRMAQDISDSSDGKTDVRGYYLELDGNRIRHMKDHVDTDSDGRNVPLSSAQAEQLTEYIDNYDEVLDVLTRKDGSTKVYLSKDTGDGHVVIVELVSKGRQSLQPVTAWQNTYEAFENIWGKKKEADSAPQDGQTPISRGYQPTSDKENSSPKSSDVGKPTSNVTPEADLEILESSDISIPTDTQNVKQNFAGNGAMREPFTPTYNEKAQPPKKEKLSRFWENTLQRTEAAAGVTEDVGEPLFYLPKTEKQSLAEAASRLSTDRQGTVENLVSAEAWSGAQVDSAANIASDLYREAQKTGNYEAYTAWRKVMDNHVIEGGRGIQALAKYSRETGENALSTIASTIEQSDLTPDQRQTLINKVGNYAARFDEITHGGENVELSDGKKAELISLIEDMARERGTWTFIKNLYSDLLKKQDGEYLKNYAYKQILAMGGDALSKATLAEKVKAYQTMAQLSSVATFKRNIGGNVSFGAVDTLVQDGLGVAIDHLLSKATGKRTVALDKGWFSSEARTGAIDAMQKSILEIAGDVDESQNRYDMTAGRAFKMSGGSLERFMSRWQQLLGYSLTTSDKFSRGAIESEQARGLNALKESGLTGEEIGELAKRAADYRLFQNQDGIAYKMSKGSHDVLNLAGFGGKVNGVTREGGFGLGDLVNTYPGVPANLGVKALEYSPANVVKGGIELIKVISDAKAGKLDVVKQQQAVMDISRGLAGLPAIALAGALFKAGLIKNWDDEDDPDIRAQNAAEGKTGVQINLTGALRYLTGKTSEITWEAGDNVESIGWLEPINAFLAIGSLMANEGEDAGIWDYAGDWVEGSIQGVLEIPVMSNIADIIDTLQYSTAENIGGKVAEAATQYAGNVAAGFIPSFVRAAAKASDEYYRDTSGDTPFERSWNQIKNAVPGLRQTLDVKLDNFGNPKKYGGTPLTRIYNAFSNPGDRKTITQSEASKIIESLYKETGNADIYPDRKGVNKISVNGENVSLTTKEKREYQRISGSTSENLIESLKNDPFYKKASPEQRAELIKELNSYAKDEAKVAWGKAKGAEVKSSYNDMREAGIADIPDYMLAKQALSTANSATDKADYSLIDDILSNFGKLSVESRAELQSASNLNVNKLLYADNLGIDSKAWYKVHNAVAKNVVATGSGKDWVTAEAINKLGGSNEDKLEMLSATVTPDGSNYNRVRGGYTRPSIVRRFDAAINSGVDFDVWTDVETLVEQLQNGNSSGWGCSTSFITQALADNGYTKEEIDDVWAIKNASGDYEGVNYLDDYWQQLIDNAGRAAAGKTVKVG